MDLGWGEILMILVLALLVYGAKLPEVARSLGRMVAGFKQSLDATQAEVTRGVAEIESDVEERPRTVRRVASKDLATEDVSAPAAEPVAPAATTATAPSSEPPQS